MSEVIYVSNEEQLEDSLPSNHKVTVFNVDYVPAIFDGYNIQYCFNETPEHDWNNFYRLKHVFHPYKGIYVIKESSLYKTLLNKVIKCKHSVAFVLSIENVKLLRLCQCFIGAISDSLETEQTVNKFLPDIIGSNLKPVDRIKSFFPIPYIIGKAYKTGVWRPVWSYFWAVKMQSLNNELEKKFYRWSNINFTYSKQGLDRLQALLEAREPEITGGKKRLLYFFNRSNKLCHCRQSIEGPHEMLDYTLLIFPIKLKHTEKYGCRIMT